MRECDAVIMACCQLVAAGLRRDWWVELRSTLWWLFHQLGTVLMGLAASADGKW
jgi:hypothetical protein